MTYNLYTLSISEKIQQFDLILGCEFIPLEPNSIVLCYSTCIVKRIGSCMTGKGYYNRAKNNSVYITDLFDTQLHRVISRITACSH